ncbi:4Fe-4S dicluster domain-containing protein [Nocardioides immobilis]|uniref:ferredoxin--NADP(+) reductase n=1 Tax=Nocardioides immobilis TaxID=2049295 RepID=A0A417XZ88_9ACTN|nr:FAD-dependent oxidoreductase [Nocardioides immobilis]RHW25688.1 4Fe-4S dicluster domain-containing protein [Nocardioides immobilis]
MTHVITRACCNDAACVAVCPKNCIQPSPGDPEFATAEMLKIDPVNCIDCGACVEVCPVDAIVPDFRLAADQGDYLALNAEYFTNHSYDQVGFREPVADSPASGLTVAVVGSGPAAMYAVERLLERTALDCEIHVYERLPVPWGLVRFGVAPDHQDTKQVTRGFERLVKDPRVHVHLNVDVGVDISHEELADGHHAVIYGTGASGARDLGIPGEELEGSISASSFVAWYNGHPDGRDLAPDLSGRRAVVIGNGNVALDVARVLATGHLGVESSDIADHALEALKGSDLEEIVVIGRRGPAEAAYTTPELLSLIHHDDVEVAVEGIDGLAPSTASLKERLIHRVEAGEFRRSTPAERRVVLKYLASPVEIVGTERVTGVTVQANRLVEDGGAVRAIPTGASDLIECSLVVHAVGYRGKAVPEVPFDDETGLMPNDKGRVHAPDGAVTPGVYVVGWSKRGPSGVIGTNKQCAVETVEALLTDFTSGALAGPRDGADRLRWSASGSFGRLQWERLDAFEREAGRSAGRPRIKVSDPDTMLAIGLGAELR